MILAPGVLAESLAADSVRCRDSCMGTKGYEGVADLNFLIPNAPNDFSGLEELVGLLHSAGLGFLAAR